MTIISHHFVSGNIANAIAPGDINAKGKKFLHSHSVTGFGEIFNRLSGSQKSSESVALPDVISQVIAAAEPSRKANAEIALNGDRATPSTKSKVSADPMIALEGNLMGKFVSEMMPKGKTSFYGSGLAGETWRGFAVDQMVGALAQSDPFKLSIKPYSPTGAIYGENLNKASDPNAKPAFTITPFAVKA